MNRILLILLLCFAFAAPVLAQEATPEPPTTIVVEDGGTVNVEADEPPVDFGALGQFGLYLMLAIAGGGSFALVLTRLDTRGKDQLEKSYESLSPSWQAVVLKIVDVSEALGKLGREVTDGKPNLPPAPPAL